MFQKSFHKLLTSLLICLGASTTALAKDYIVPPMVNIPAGDFMMGTNGSDKEASPMHAVSVEAFQLAKYPVTVAEFRKFVEDTGYTMESSCKDKLDRNWLSSPKDVGTANWDNNRYLESEYQPVTCINFKDTQAYIKWLNKKTGQTYRLATEQEFEYALRANTTSRHFWGDDPNMTQACQYGNFSDHSGEYFPAKEFGASYVGFLGHAHCDDGEPYVAIVGLYRPNPFGLHDMMGNILQLLGSCFYEGYEPRTDEEMDISKCEFISHRGGSWHYIPHPNSARGSYKREGWSAGALVGFRLAADGQNIAKHETTKKFELALQQAQKKRLLTRPKIPQSPQNVHLNKIGKNKYKISWQPSDDTRVSSYEIHRSKRPHSHLIGPFYREHYDKIDTVSANLNSAEVTLPEEGGSFRVIAVTEQLTSLPSQPVSASEIKTLDIPGKLYIQETSHLDNALLAYSRQPDDPEPYYVSRLHQDFENSMVSASFNIRVKKSGWYAVNYRGRSQITGDFFKLWINNSVIGSVSYDPDIDDKTSNRHKVYLEKGTHTLEANVQREGFDWWSLTWLEFKEINS